MMRTVRVTLAIAAACLLLAGVASAGLREACLTGTAPDVLNDLGQINAVRGVIDAACPCGSFNGGTGKTYGDYIRCTTAAIKSQVPGGLRRQCAGTVKKLYRQSTCGRTPTLHAEPCIETNTITGRITCGIRATTTTDGTSPTDACTSTPGFRRIACAGYSTCIDAADSNRNGWLGFGDTGLCGPAANMPTPTPTTNRPTATPTPAGTQAICGTACVALQTDPANRGACGNAGAHGENCS